MKCAFTLKTQVFAILRLQPMRTLPISVTEFLLLCIKIAPHNCVSETGMNFLLLMALEKVAYLPFAYIVDQVW